MKINIKTTLTLTVFLFALLSLNTSCKNKNNSGASTDLLEEARKMQQGENTTDIKTTTTAPTNPQTTTISAEPNLGKIVTTSNVWIKTKEKTWEERTPAGVLVGTYQETGKDEWSYALEGPANVAFNLWLKKVLYHDTKSESEIIESSINVTGVNASKVVTSSNIWLKTGDKKWEKQDLAGNVAGTFKETDRDDWSVYMNDGTTNMQFDLFRKKAINKKDNEKEDILESWYLKGS